MPQTIAPNQSDTYKAVRDAAKAAGMGSAFSDLCMLLGAPSSLKAFFLVIENIQSMLQVLPPEWGHAADDEEETEESADPVVDAGEELDESVDRFFPGWTDLTDWVLKEEVRDDLNKRVPHSLEHKLRTKVKGGVKRVLHPLSGKGLTQFPIYATLCNTQELDRKPRKDYAMLQAQLLIARRKELERQSGLSGSGNYADLYENYSGEKDFAEGVRRPNAAALAVRDLSTAAFGELLELMHPERRPSIFARYLPPHEKLPRSNFPRKKLEHIRNYCELKTHARPDQDRVGSGGRGGGPTIHGHIAYSEGRFGTEYPNGDPDDDLLDISDQELISEYPVDLEEALTQGVHPLETVFEEPWMLVGDSQHNGTTPGRIAEARSGVRTIEIDKERMPWSAIHLRSKEIEGTLLKTLASTAKRVLAEEEIDSDDLENCALIAVCLETSRRLSDAVKLRFVKSADGDFCFVGASKSRSSLWRWKSTEPVYKKKRPTLKGEVQRLEFLSYTVHPVADILLTAWKKRARKNKRTGPHLFMTNKEYDEKRLKAWLLKLEKEENEKGERNRIRRLTIAKIVRIKWSLLSQQSGGDFAEASMVLGLPHVLAEVPTFYSLYSVDRVTRSFQQATSVLWGNVWDEATSSRPNWVPAADTLIDQGWYTGCEACPKPNIVRNSIRITRESAYRFARSNMKPDRSDGFVEMFNRAVLYLLWHQFYAIGARAICLPYITETVGTFGSGLAYVADKDDGSGHKARLVWMYPPLLQHMESTERIIERVRRQLDLDRYKGCGPVFFIEKKDDGSLKAVNISPKWLDKVAPELPFPSNTPRRVMCVELTAAGLSSEMVEVFMGHWLDRREPWGKWSSFDYAAYLERLRALIPGILANLGFAWPLKRGIHD